MNNFRPKTVDEAVQVLMEELSNAELEYVRKHQPIQMHATLGREIRNRFGMWEEDNNDLLRVCHPLCLGDELAPGLAHPDEASQVILIALKDKLRGK